MSKGRTHVTRTHHRLRLTAVAGFAALCILSPGAAQPVTIKPVSTFPSAAGSVDYQFTAPKWKGSTRLSWRDGGAVYRMDLRSPRLTETVLGNPKSLFVLSPANEWRSATARHERLKPTNVWINGAWMPYPTPSSGAGKLVGSGRVLGKLCQIRQLYTMRIWYWQGVPLQMERAADHQIGVLRLTAVKIDLKRQEPRSRFAVPSDYHVTEGMITQQRSSG